MDPAVPAPAWLRKGSFVQGTAAGQIDAIGANAATASGNQVAGPNNTATGVLIPSASDLALARVIGDGGNLSGTFQGSVESVTPDDFEATPGTLSRADFFELVPGTSADGSLNAKGRYLGYFELAADGALSFHNGAPSPLAPRIVGIQRTGSLTTVQVAAETGVKYSLRASDSLSALAKTWSVVAGPVAGTGPTLSLQDTTAGGSRFYAVEAQP